MHPRMQKRRTEVRRQRWNRIREEVRLHFAPPDSDAEGGSIDHHDKPAVPVWGLCEVFKSLSNIDLKAGDEYHDHGDSEDNED